MPTPLSCPFCDANLDAGPIDPKHHEFYNPPYHYTRAIAVYVKKGMDIWTCPHCRKWWKDE